MDDLSKRLFLAGVNLETISNILGYDEEEIISLLENPHLMTEEEKEVIEMLLNEKI